MFIEMPVLYQEMYLCDKGLGIKLEDYEEEFEDTKGVIRIRISKKYRQHNGQKKKYKRTNNHLQNIHIKLKIE
jgi:tRNA A-37 threonylcarbamoyl transferase component Bud32